MNSNGQTQSLTLEEAAQRTAEQLAPSVLDRIMDPSSKGLIALTPLEILTEALRSVFQRGFEAVASKQIEQIRDQWLAEVAPQFNAKLEETLVLAKQEADAGEKAFRGVEISEFVDREYVLGQGDCITFRVGAGHGPYLRCETGDGQSQMDIDILKMIAWLRQHQPGLLGSPEVAKERFRIALGQALNIATEYGASQTHEAELVELRKLFEVG